jgi:hypothetical protein
MNAKLLKFARRAPLFFALVYDYALQSRRHVRACRKIRKLNADLQQQIRALLDASWGWDIDRETYDNLIILQYTVDQAVKDYTADVDFER